MLKIVENKPVRWSEHLIFELCALTGFGMENLIIFIEGVISGKSINQFEHLGHMIHWTITSVWWGLVALILIKFSIKKYSFDVFMYKNRPNKNQLIISVILLIIITTVSIVDWNGFKPFIEFKHHGAVKFTFQYIYYTYPIILLMFVL
ncbi:hypothetical protein KQI38_21660 [Tissierella carlieri]|uniref:hypothetical protein n=1 Tax=Tissierella carlieri TaxID=689904 RepID=UPI001C100CD3|nr:hypothetical protein [Tissierella carlieri]MBU5314635.1 hypothetical protein [Tissierella carlieri]